MSPRVREDDNRGHPPSHTPLRSRRAMRPSRCKPSARKGVGDTGCPVHPQPRARMVVKKCARVFTAVAPEITRHPRTQWFTAYSALSPEIGLSCLRRRRKIFSADLTPASTRQDHTSSPSALGALVRSAFRVHRIPSRVRDDRDTPLLVGRDGDGYAGDLGSHGTGIFLAMGIDSPNHTKSSPSGAGVFGVTSPIVVIARSEATKQSSFLCGAMDCFAALAMTKRIRL
jgi:hypothetical protein